MRPYIALSAQRGEEKARPEATGMRRKSRRKSWRVLGNIRLYYPVILIIIIMMRINVRYYKPLLSAHRVA